MATITASIGSNAAIDTETPASSSTVGDPPGGNIYTLTFGTAPTGVSVGDKGTVASYPAGGGTLISTYTYHVIQVTGDFKVKYISDTESEGDASPYGLYADSGSSGSPDQAPMVFGRFYSTITLWEADLDEAEGSDGLYESGDDAVGECYDDSVFDESVTINGGGTVGLDSRTLSVASGERHDGTAGNGARMVQSGNNSGRVIVSIANTTVEWLELNCGGYRNDNGAAYNTDLGSDTADSTPWTCQRCIVHNLDGSSNQRGIDNTSKGDGKIQNNIIYNIAGSSNTVWGIRAGRNAARNIYNNTVHDIDGSGGAANVYGILVGNSSAINVKNNISTNALGGSSVNECYSEGASVSPAYNLSSDATATGTGSLTSKAAADQFVSTTGGSEDLHLKDNADALRAGVDLGTTPSGVEIDIDGRDRDAEGDDWDIGADQCDTCTTSVSVSSDQIILLEHLLNVSGNNVSNIDYILGVSGNRVIPLSHTLSLSNNYQILEEHLASLAENKQSQLEHLLSLSENRQAQVEYLSEMSVSNQQLLVEHLLSMESAHAVSIGHLLNLSFSGELNIDHIGGGVSVSAGLQVAVEYLSSMASSEGISVEHLLSLLANSQAQTEHLLSFGFAQEFSVEHLLSLSEDRHSQIEYLSSLSLDSETLIEYLASLDPSQELSVEHLLSLLEDQQIPIEHTASGGVVSADLAMPIEYLSSIVSTQELLMSHLLSIASSKSISLENLVDIFSIGGAMTTRAVIEHLLEVSVVTEDINVDHVVGATSGDLTFPAEHLLYLDDGKIIVLSFGGQPSFNQTISVSHIAALTSSNVSPVSHLLGVSESPDINAEHLLELSINRQGLATRPTVPMSLDREFPVEYLLSMSSSNDILIETLSSIAKDLAIPLSWRVGISSDGVFYIDWTHNISAVDRESLIEHLLDVEQSGEIPLDYKGGIAVNEVIPLGWQGFLTETSILAWVLNERGTLWTINSRGELTWVLSSRGNDWVLPAKSTDWQVNTRPSNWVL